MPREIPDCPKKPNPTVEAGRIYEIELITPMVAKRSAEPRVIDPSFPDPADAGFDKQLCHFCAADLRSIAG